MPDDQIVAASSEAASPLGVRVAAPHSLELPDGTVLVVEAFLPDFGGPQGVVAVAVDDHDVVNAPPGRTVSSLNSRRATVASMSNCFETL